MIGTFVAKRTDVKKILFLHGFFASGQCVPAVALKEAFEGEVEVMSLYTFLLGFRLQPILVGLYVFMLYHINR